MRIFQLIQTLTPGDAISNNTLLLDRAFKSKGIDANVYAISRGEGLETSAGLYEQLPKPDKNDIIIYHMCEKSVINTEIKTMNCKKIVIYHNTTPAEFLIQYFSEEYQKQIDSINEIKGLKDTFDWCIAVSEFNKKDLIKLGYDENKISVIPIYLDFDEYRQQPDSRTADKFRHGKVNIVFVGRLTANKKQEDIIKAFAYYKKYVNNNSRLILAGTSPGGTYAKKLLSYVDTLDIDDVIFTWTLSFREILAIYSIADVFLCMSEHEGFCIPLVEAMMFDVPIIAYNSTAVPYTLNGAGVLIDNKDPELISNIINKTITDENYKSNIIKSQQKRLKDFESEVVLKQLIDVIKKVEAL